MHTQMRIGYENRENVAYKSSRLDIFLPSRYTETRLFRILDERERKRGEEEFALLLEMTVG